MKKIMFSEKYGLEQAVLEGRKTMTRRVIKRDFIDINAYHANGDWCYIAETEDGDTEELRPHYRVGELVAIAQSYKKILSEHGLPRLDGAEGAPDYGGLPEAYRNDAVVRALENSYGYGNKMHVAPGLMPHHIRIIDLKYERLWDISDEDCMKEGVMEGEFMNTWDRFYYDEWGDVANHITFKTPLEAFASLIDKVSGKGTWDSNPWVAAYTFKLVDFRKE